MDVDAEVLLVCPKHGLIRRWDLIVMTPGSSISVERGQGPCPECKTFVPMVDATYAADHKGRVTREIIRAGSQRERIEVLRSTVEQAQRALRAGEDPAVLAAQLETAAATLASPVSRVLSTVTESLRKDSAGWAAVLITVLLWWVDQQNSISAAEIQQIVDQTVQQLLDGTALPSPADPTPPTGVTPPPGPAPTATTIPAPKTH